MLKLAPGEPGDNDEVYHEGGFTIVVNRYLSDRFGPFTIDSTLKGLVIRSKLTGTGRSCRG